VRVEEELEAQRELMREGFAQMDKRFEILQGSIDKRFEQVDKRFDQVDKRFEDMSRSQTRWFTVLSLMLAIIGAAATVGTFF
jgi:hypothetical protein